MQDREIQNIISGGYHSFILTKSGELFSFGFNDNGQLGLGDNDNKNVPTLLMKTWDDVVPSLNPPLGTDRRQDRVKTKRIHQIICGAFHTFILRNNGELFAFGFNLYGQLGLGDTDNINTPTLLMIDENIVSINGTMIEKIKWNPDIYQTLSITKQREIKYFLLVCHCYKKIYQIKMIKYMRHAIITLLF